MEVKTTTEFRSLLLATNNCPNYETNASKAWLLRQDLIYVECKPNVNITLKDAVEDMELTRKMSEGVNKWALVIEMNNIKSISKEARDYYSITQNRNGCNTGVALIAESTFSKVIANFFIGVESPVPPTRVFISKEDALTWVLDTLKSKKQ